MNFFPSGLPLKSPEVASQQPSLAGREASLPTRAGENFRSDGILHFPNGKVVDEKIAIKPWPSITGFRTWKLIFKKQVAAASKYSEQAFAWITEVETAKSFEELADSGAFPQLDARLSSEIDSVLSGEFRKQVQVKETELSLKGKMIKGRQIAWMMYKHFKLSEVDGAMLEWEELLSVELKGDNLQQFENDWGAMCLVVRELPDEKSLKQSTGNN